MVTPEFGCSGTTNLPHSGGEPRLEDSLNTGPIFPVGDASPNPPVSRASEPSQVRVLLVDDQPDMLTMMDFMLRRRSYQVATAESAERALQMVELFEPHIVVSDIGMPDMDGYQLMEALQGREEAFAFKSIALTGFGMEEDQNRALSAGYDAHLTKPVDFDNLISMIESLANSFNKK